MSLRPPSRSSMRSPRIAIRTTNSNRNTSNISNITTTNNETTTTTNNNNTNSNNHINNNSSRSTQPGSGNDSLPIKPTRTGH